MVERSLKQQTDRNVPFHSPDGWSLKSLWRKVCPVTSCWNLRGEGVMQGVQKSGTTPPASLPETSYTQVETVWSLAQRQWGWHGCPGPEAVRVAWHWCLAQRQSGWHAKGTDFHPAGSQGPLGTPHSRAVAVTGNEQVVSVGSADLGRSARHCTHSMRSSALLLVSQKAPFPGIHVLHAGSGGRCRVNACMKRWNLMEVS